MQIFRIVVAMILLFVLGLCLEYIAHPNVGIEQTVYLLKADIMKIFKALCTKEKVRHFFDQDLFNDLKKIAEPYATDGIETEVFPCFNAGLWFIQIYVVSAEKMDLESMKNLSELFKVRFRKYLFVKQLKWRNYVHFSSCNNENMFWIFYEEFEEDKEAFENRYREQIRQKCSADCGYIRDDALEKELKNVD